MTTKVFFNESCKICKKEIDLYKKMENDLSWVDIHQQEAKVTNLDTDQLSRRLHVLEDGKLYSGAKAFLIVWSRIPKLKILTSFVFNKLICVFLTINDNISSFLYPHSIHLSNG